MTLNHGIYCKLAQLKRMVKEGDVRDMEVLDDELHDLIGRSLPFTRR